jgi:integrase
MRIALTDVLLRSLKPPSRGRLQITDTRTVGLLLRVTSGGAYSWCFRCHNPFAGRQTARVTIGPWPTVTLAEARARAGEMRRQVLAGTPLVSKPKHRAAAAAQTFAHLAQRYLTEHAERHKKAASARLDEGNLRLHVLPHWGERRYDGIGRGDIIELLEKLVTAGKPVAANRVQSLVSSVFAFGVDAGLLQANPVARLRRRGAESAKTRVLSNDELRLFWAGTTTAQVGLALKLQLLTAARPGEIGGAMIAELEHLDDPAKARWIIPGARIKNGRTHVIPLSAAALQIVRAALALNKPGAVYLFGEGGLPRHLMGRAMLALAKQAPPMGEHADAAATWAANVPTPHDLRRTCATRLSELRVPKEDRDAILNHAPQDVGGKHYDHYGREREKRVALSTWAAALHDILEPRERGATVVPMLR